MISFNDFLHKYKLRDKATSNIKIYQVFSSIGLDNVGLYLGDGPFSIDIGIVKLHPSKGRHWVLYINETYFESYGRSPPQKLIKFIIKRKRHCLYLTKKEIVNVQVIVYINFT